MSCPRFVLGPVLVVLAACSGVTSSSSSPEAAPRLDRFVTGADIVAHGGSTAYDGLRLVRSASTVGRDYASTRNPAGDGLVVYLDGARLGDPRLLREIMPGEVASMEYLDASTASIRYGSGHTGGALVVRTR